MIISLWGAFVLFPKGSNNILPWSYGSWIYNYLCNQRLSPLKLWDWMPLTVDVVIATLCDTVFQWRVADQWFSPGTSVSSPNKTECQPSPSWYLGLQRQQRFKQTIKNLHRFASSQRDHILSKTNEWHHKHSKVNTCS